MVSLMSRASANLWRNRLCRVRMAVAVSRQVSITCLISVSMRWAVISLSLFAGSLNVEIFRSGIEAVPRATVEAASALGFTRLQTYPYVVLPLALRISLPSLGTNLVNLVKTTSLA